MPDRDETMLVELGAHERNEMLERAAVAELRVLSPGPFGQDPTGGILGDESG
jgi:hypothetical protein